MKLRLWLILLAVLALAALAAPPAQYHIVLPVVRGLLAAIQMLR